MFLGKSKAVRGLDQVCSWCRSRDRGRTATRIAQKRQLWLAIRQCSGAEGNDPTHLALPTVSEAEHLGKVV
jgi:hypothetical protein